MGYALRARGYGLYCHGILIDTLLVLPDEARLLAAAKTNPDAVGQIYDHYADRVYGFLMKRCRHKETAEDITSRTFMKFIEALPTIEWRGVSIGAWLYRAASNALIDHWRSASVRMDAELDDAHMEMPGAHDPAWVAELSMEHDKLIEILKELSPRDQEILDLRFFAGLDPQEIAPTLDVTANHASVLLYRALGRLRKKYHERYA